MVLLILREAREALWKSVFVFVELRVVLMIWYYFFIFAVNSKYCLSHIYIPYFLTTTSAVENRNVSSSNTLCSILDTLIKCNSSKTLQQRRSWAVGHVTTPNK